MTVEFEHSINKVYFAYDDKGNEYQFVCLNSLNPCYIKCIKSAFDVSMRGYLDQNGVFTYYNTNNFGSNALGGAMASSANGTVAIGLPVLDSLTSGSSSTGMNYQNQQTITGKSGNTTVNRKFIQFTKIESFTPEKNPIELVKGAVYILHTVNSKDEMFVCEDSAGTIRFDREIDNHAIKHIDVDTGLIYDVSENRELCLFGRYTISNVINGNNVHYTAIAEFQAGNKTNIAVKVLEQTIPTPICAISANKFLSYYFINNDYTLTYAIKHAQFEDSNFSYENTNIVCGKIRNLRPDILRNSSNVNYIMLCEDGSKRNFTIHERTGTYIVIVFPDHSNEKYIIHSNNDVYTTKVQERIHVGPSKKIVKHEYFPDRLVISNLRFIARSAIRALPE